MKILRPEESQFEQINDYPYEPHYVDFNECRMHYIDEGSGETILALHGEPSWSYLYRKFIPILSPSYRFIAPDLIGFGKSDKIVGWKNYSFKLHFDSIKNFVEKLDLNEITLIVQDWGGLLGLSYLGAFPEKIKRVVILNTFLPVGGELSPAFNKWRSYVKLHPSLPVGKILQRATYSTLSDEVIKAYDAPFPNRKHKGGAKSFPLLVPGKATDPGVPEMKRAREVLSKWDKPALVLFSDKDPIMRGVESFFYKLIPTANDQPKIMIKDAGHFLQEDKGEEIATYVDKFMKDELSV